MNVQTVQHAMLKRAGLFGNTMVGRWITDTMGPHTFVSDALGASALDMIDHQAKTQLGWQPPKGYTKEELAAQAAAQKRINDHIDRGLAAAQQRLAAGNGVTQQPGYKAPTAVANTQAKPRVQAAPPPQKKQMSGQQASQELIKGNRMPEAQKADKSYTAAIRRRDSAGGRR